MITKLILCLTWYVPVESFLFTDLILFLHFSELDSVITSNNPVAMVINTQHL